MTNGATSDGSDKLGGYVVRRPQATDAIGSALRGVYGEPPALPADMFRSLDRLDRLTGRS